MRGRVETRSQPAGTGAEDPTVGGRGAAGGQAPGAAGEGSFPDALPEGSVLLHVGPPKTASTTLQAALYAARPELAAHGVRHAGPSRHPAAAVQAVLGRQSRFAGGGVPPIRRWRALVREVTEAAEPRVVVSSELLADATPDQAHRLVDDLGRSRVHVAVTLRPVARILPSQWQQLVQNGTDTSFDDWLETVLHRPRSRPAAWFWQRHRHDALIARWADVVGQSRVTAIVLDDRDPDLVLRAFERLLGVQRGLLHARRETVNRSLTLAEVESIRAFNTAFRRSGLPRRELNRIMHFGAARHMKRRPPDPASPRIVLPGWSLPRTAELARRIAAGVARSGVVLVGDPARLAEVPPTGPARATHRLRGSADVAASMSMGILYASGRARRRSEEQDTRAVADAVPAYVIGGIVAARLWRAVTSRRIARRRRRR